jgi:hypothetical protein
MNSAKISGFQADGPIPKKGHSWPRLPLSPDHADTKTNAGYTHAEVAALRRAVDAVPALKWKRAK